MYKMDIMPSEKLKQFALPVFNGSWRIKTSQNTNKLKAMQEKTTQIIQSFYHGKSSQINEFLLDGKTSQFIRRFHSQRIHHQSLDQSLEQSRLQCWRSSISKICVVYISYLAFLWSVSQWRCFCTSSLRYLFKKIALRCSGRRNAMFLLLKCDVLAFEMRCFLVGGDWNI